MLDRYNVIDEAELAAVANRFANGKQTANMTPSAPAPSFRPQQFLDPCLTIRRAPGLPTRCVFRARPAFCNFQPQQFLGP